MKYYSIEAERRITQTTTFIVALGDDEDPDLAMQVGAWADHAGQGGFTENDLNRIDWEDDDDSADWDHPVECCELDHGSPLLFLSGAAIAECPALRNLKSRPDGTWSVPLDMAQSEIRKRQENPPEQMNLDLKEQ